MMIKVMVMSISTTANTKYGHTAIFGWRKESLTELNVMTCNRLGVFSQVTFVFFVTCLKKYKK